MSEHTENNLNKAHARIRKEYDNYLPQAKKLLEYGRNEIQHLLNKQSYDLQPHQKIEVTGRIKTFQKCISKLTEAGVISDTASLFSGKVKDIVGLRIAVFPNDLIGDIHKIIKKAYLTAQEDHREELYRLQYFIDLEGLGTVNDKVEIQIMPYLLSHYWNIEHSIYDSKKYNIGSEKWRDTHLAIIEGEMTEKIIRISDKLTDIMLGNKPSPTIRLVNLTYTLLELNALLDSGACKNISLEEIKAEISKGSVLEYVAEKGKGKIDLSLVLRQKDQDGFIKEYNKELKNILEAYGGDERRKWGIQNSGVALLIAWTNEIIQRGSGWEPRLT